MIERLIEVLFPPQCGGCDRGGSGICETCLPKGGSIHASTETLTVTALAPYEGRVRRAILALKDGRRDVATALGERLADFCDQSTVLAPVPTTRARKAVRGFDGAELLAVSAARQSGATVQSILSQVAGDAQRGRDRTQRLAARGRFRCRTSFNGEHCVLLDDVMTTGTTLEDCAATIRASGGIVEHAIVVAVSNLPGAHRESCS